MPGADKAGMSAVGRRATRVGSFDIEADEAKGDYIWNTLTDMPHDLLGMSLGGMSF
jgi:hypothetical protein